MTEKQNKPRVALVIGSGGIKCAALIGVWKMLLEEKIDVDLVVGCSGGAVFGAAVALGYSPQKIIDLSKELWSPKVKQKINYAGIRHLLFPRVCKFENTISIFDNQSLIESVEAALGKNTRFNETKIPFRCVKTDFKTGEMEVLLEGPLARAVIASASIPLVFPPIWHKRMLLMDGGMSNPLPVDVAIKEGADLIIAVGFETPLYSSLNAPGNYITQMTNILINQLVAKSYAFHNLVYHSEIVMIAPHFEEVIHVNDIHKLQFIVEKGEEEARKHMPYLKRVLAELGEKADRGEAGG